MSTHQNIITEYIMLAIPLFVVIGYYARTVKVSLETSQETEAVKAAQETERTQRIEDEERAFQRQMKLAKAEAQHAENLAKIEAQKSVPKSVPQVSHETVSQDKSLETLKAEILAELAQDKPNMSQLASRLDIGRSTLYRHLGTLEGTGEIVKNGQGYKPNNSNGMVQHG